MKMFIGLWPKETRDKTPIKHSRFCKTSIPSSILEQRYIFTIFKSLSLETGSDIFACVFPGWGDYLH